MKRLHYTLVLAVVLISSALQAQSWSKLTLDFDSNLYDVTFVNTNVGYVSGDNGQVFKTVNGGATWVGLNTVVNQGLASIQFLNENVGYAASGFFQDYASMIKTVDGGISWSKINLPASKTGGGMWFVNQNVGFYAYADSLYGNSTIVRTTNGGATWTQVYSGEGWISYFSFPSETVGYATVNNGTILKTTDGGLNWTVLGLSNALWGSGISFYTENIGLAGGQPMAGGNATIFTTNNGGTTWNPIETDAMIFKISHADLNNVYALSVDSSGKGFMIKSEDGGATWEEEDLAETQLRGIQFLNKDLGYAVGANGVILKYTESAGVVVLEKGKNLFLFPNPVSNVLNVTIADYESSDNTLHIFNSRGELVKSEALHFATQQLDITDLGQGFYFVQILNNSSIKTQKLWIAR